MIKYTWSDAPVDFHSAGKDAPLRQVVKDIYLYICIYRGVWGPSLAENLDSGLHISVRGSGGPFAGVRRSIAWDSPVGRPVEARLQIAVHVHKFNIGPGPRPGL